MQSRVMSVLWMLFAAFTLTAGGYAQEAAKPPAKYVKPPAMQFMKVEEANGKPTALRIAVVDYKPVDGSPLTITLVGVVHIGDKEYYTALAPELAKPTKLLYELVGPKGSKPETGKQSQMAQLLGYGDIAKMLGLSHQMKEISYSPAHFVHADVDFQDLIRRGRKQGEDEYTLALRTLADVLQMTNKEGTNPFGLPESPDKGGEVDPLQALLDPTGGIEPSKMKELMVRQLGKGIDQIEGITLFKKYLIGERNQNVCEELDAQIAAGVTHIGIFYGAGHNQDFHHRFCTDYGLKVTDVRWYTAWDMSKPIPKQKQQDPIQQLLRGLLEDLDDE